MDINDISSSEAEMGGSAIGLPPGVATVGLAIAKVTGLADRINESMGQVGQDNTGFMAHAVNEGGIVAMSDTGVATDRQPNSRTASTNAQGPRNEKDEGEQDENRNRNNYSSGPSRT